MVNLSLQKMKQRLSVLYMPALFPFFVLASLVVGSGLAQRMGGLLEPVMRPLFRVNGSCAAALALGFVGGYPVGARTAIQLYQQGQCSKTEAQRLLAFCNNSGPAFILGAVGAGVFGSGKAGIALYLCHMAASLLVGLLFRFYRPGDGPSSPRRMGERFQAVSFSAAFPRAVTGAMASSLNICAFILCFSVVVRLLTLSGLLDGAAGLLSALPPPLRLSPEWSRRLLVGALVVILCCLYHCMGEVDGTDYPFDPPPPRWSGGALILTVATVLVLGGALGYSVGAGCPMHWAPRDPAEQAGVTETRAYLENLGFPAEVLDDLTPEDIAACAGAIQVVVQEDDQPVSSHRLRAGGDASPVEPEELLHFVSVAVEVRERQWKLFHHVRWNWNGEQDFYGTEAMVVRPVYGTGVGGWIPGSAAPTGRVLCERKGRTYAAPCYSVGDQIGQTSSVFLGLSPWEAVCGTFSLPRHSQNSRGYVSYSALGTPEGGGMNSHVSYVHQVNWFRYPAVTAAEYRTAGAVGNTFWTVQTLMSYYPPDESADCPTF